MTNIRLLIIDDHNKIIEEVKDYFNNIDTLKILLETKIAELVKEDEKIGWLDLYDDNKLVLITKILHELGVPTNLKGYQYLREGIQIAYNNPNIESITKNIYPEIARKYNSTISCVERAMRHAIEISWNRASLDMMEELFGYSIDIDKAKPTNSEYIITIADKLRLDTIISLLST